MVSIIASAAIVMGTWIVAVYCIHRAIRLECVLRDTLDELNATIEHINSIAIDE